MACVLMRTDDKSWSFLASKCLNPEIAKLLSSCLETVSVQVFLITLSLWLVGTFQSNNAFFYHAMYWFHATDFVRRMAHTNVLGQLGFPWVILEQDNTSVQQAQAKTGTAIYFLKCNFILVKKV